MPNGSNNSSHAAARGRAAAIRAAALLPLSLMAASLVSAQESDAGRSSARQAATAPAARNTARMTLAVATRAIARGDTLRAGDFTLVDTTIAWRWSMPPKAEQVEIGWVAQRAITEGEVLRAPSVQPPPVVTSGAPVKVIYEDGAVKLELQGVATHNAPLGAPVVVRVNRTRRLEGIAIAPNTVRLR